MPENQNDLRRMQLRELAQLNGTLRENDGLRCNNCGATDHKSWLVKFNNSHCTRLKILTFAYGFFSVQINQMLQTILYARVVEQLVT